MGDYNLGTARGRIVLDASDATSGAAQAETAAHRVEGSFGKASASAGKVGGVLGAGALAVAAGFGLAVKSAADFEKQISGIAAVSGATGPELESLRKKALQLGKDTQFSASEAATAMEELVKAGVSTEDVLNGAADAAVALAAAGGVGIPEAATLASNAMNAFGVTAKELPGIVDQIAGAANASAIDVGELGQSLAQVGAVAHLAGLSFEDTAVAIAEMGNAGIKGSDAGTSLKTFLQNLIPTTEQQIGLFQEMGLQTFESAAAMKALRDNGVKPLGSSNEILNKQLQELAAKLSDSKVGSATAQKEFLKLGSATGFLQNQFFTATGETKKLADIQGVLNNATKNMTKEQKLAALQVLFGSDAIRAAAVLADNGAAGYDKLSKAINSTSAADVAKKRMDNFNGSLEQMKGSLETAGIAIGTVLLPAVRSLVDFVTRVINGFLSLNPNIQKAIIIFVGVAAAVAGVVAVILLVVAAIGAIAGPLAIVATIIGTTVGVLLGWIVIIPIIIAALAVLIFFIIKNFDKIKKFIGAVLTAVKNFFVSIFTAVVGFLKPIMSKILGVLLLPIRLYIAYVKFVFGLLVTIIQTALSVVGAIWSAFWNTFGALIQAVLGVVFAFYKLIFTLILVIAYQTLRALLAVWSAVWGAIKAVITPILRFIAALFTTIFNAIKTVIVTVFNFLKPYIQGAIAFIKTVLEGVGAVVGKVVGFFKAIYDGIVEKVSAVISWIAGLGGKVLSAIGDLSHLLYDVGKKIIQGLINGITDKFNDVKGVLNDLTSKLTDWKGPEAKDKILLTQSGVLIMQSLINGFIDQIPQVRATLEGVTNEIPRAVGTQTNAPQIVLPVVPAQASKQDKGGEKNVTVNNYNPIAETGSVSTTKAMNRLAALGV